MVHIFQYWALNKFDLKSFNELRLYETRFLKNNFPRENIVSIFSFISISPNGDKSYGKLGMLIQFENWLLEMVGDSNVRKINLKYGKGEIIWNPKHNCIVLWK